MTFFNKKDKKRKTTDIVKNCNPWVQCHDLNNKDNRGLPKKRSGCFIKDFFVNLFK